jgi:hypothetical protein
MKRPALMLALFVTSAPATAGDYSIGDMVPLCAALEKAPSQSGGFALNPSHEGLSAAVFYGYISGVVGMLATAYASQTFCIPQGVNMMQVAAIFLKYGREHAQQHHLPLHDHVPLAS